jgi:hypothetical protein
LIETDNFQYAGKSQEPKHPHRAKINTACYVERQNCEQVDQTKKAEYELEPISRNHQSQQVLKRKNRNRKYLDLSKERGLPCVEIWERFKRERNERDHDEELYGQVEAAASQAITSFDNFAESIHCARFNLNLTMGYTAFVACPIARV